MQNVWSKSFCQIPRSILAGSLVAILLQACSLEARRTPVTLRLDLTSIKRALESSGQKQADVSQAFSAPQGFGDLSCLGVNVASDLIPVRPMPQNLRFRPWVQPQRFSTVQSFVELNATTLAQPTVETQITVPNNIGLTVQLWGIKTELGGCPGTAGRDVGRVAVYALGQKSFLPTDLSTVVDFALSRSSAADLLADSNRVFDELLVTFDPPSAALSSTNLQAYPLSGTCTESGQGVLLRFQTQSGATQLGLPVCTGGTWSTSVDLSALASLPAGQAINLTADHGDGADKKANTARLTLNAPGPPPPGPALPNVYFTINTFIYQIGDSVALTPTSTGGPVATCTISPAFPAGSGLSFNTSTCSVTGTASAPMSQTTFSITPTNASGSAAVSGQLTLTILDSAPAASPPIITFSPNASLTLTAGTALSPLSPTNTGGTITSCTVNPPFPGGMTLSSTCVVGGTPQLPSSQTVYTITATNAGGSAPAALSIAVLAANQPPTLLYSTATTSNPISHTGLASLLGVADPEADLISFEIYEILSGGLVRMVSGVATTLTVGDRLQPNSNVDWTPPSGGMGTGPAFRVRAFDGQSYSSTIADVYVTAAAQTSTPASGIAFKPGTTRREPSVPVFVGSCGTASHILISESTTQPAASDSGWQSCSTSTSTPTSFTWDSGTNGAGLADWSTGSRALQVWSKTATGVVSSTPATLTIPAHGTFVGLSAHGNETCAVGTDNRIYCWGDGQGRTLPLADMSVLGAFAPAYNTTQGSLKDIAVGKDGGCLMIDSPPAPLGDGNTHAICTGLYISSSGNSQSAPIFYQPLSDNVAQVSVSAPSPYASPSPGVTQSGGHACVLGQSGSLYCWGDNTSGQVNTGTASSTPVISPMAAISAGGSSAFSAVSAGNKHTCAITVSGALYCWGDGTGFGLGTAGPSGPVRLNGSPGSSPWVNYTQVVAGDRATCGIDTAGRVHCWGTRQVWNSGSSTYSDQPYFDQLIDAAYMSVTVGPNHTCALTPAGVARCWGENYNGQLGAPPQGQNTFIPASAAVVVPGAFSRIAAGSDHTCGLTPDKKIQCWGANWSGQLGQGTTSAPTLIGTPVEINMVTAWSLAMNQNLWNLAVPEGAQATTTIALTNRFDLPSTLMPQSLTCSATPNQYGPADPLNPSDSSNATRLYLGAAGCTCSGLSCSFSLTATPGSGSNYPGLWINQGVQISISHPGSQDPVPVLYPAARITPSTYCANLGYGLSQAGHCISAWGLKKLGTSWTTGWLGNQVPPDDGSAWVAVLGPFWDEDSSTQLYPDRLATFASRDWARLWMLGGRLDVTPGTYLHVLDTNGWVNSSWYGNSSSLNVYAGATVTGLPANGMGNLTYCNQSATSATGTGYCPGGEPLFATTQTSCPASQGFEWRTLATGAYCSRALELSPKTVGAFTAAETQKTESFYGWANFSTYSAPTCSITGASTGINLAASSCSCYSGALNCSVTAVAASTLTRPNLNAEWVTFVVSVGGYSVSSQLTIQGASGGTPTPPSLDYGTVTRQLFAGVFGQLGPVSVSTGWAAPTSCTASPPLPIGLSIDPQSCLISGTPVSEQAATTHIITATNSAGSAPASISLQIMGQLQILPKLASTDYAIASADAGNQIRLSYLNAAEPASFSVLSGLGTIGFDGIYAPAPDYSLPVPQARRSTATVQVSDELSRVSTLNIKNIPVRVNGPVYATAISSDGAYAYLGGSFSALNPYLTPRLAVLDEGTGDLSSHGCNFQNGFDGEIRALAISNGYAYVGGQFAKYRGQATAALAKVRLDTCELVATFNKGIGAASTPSVNAIAVSGTAIYVGGNLTSYGGTTLTAPYLVKLDATTGVRDTAFNPSGVDAAPGALLMVPGTVPGLFVGLSTCSSPYPLKKLNPTTGSASMSFTVSYLGGISGCSVLALAHHEGVVYAGGNLLVSSPQSFGLAALDATTGMISSQFASGLGYHFDGATVRSLAVGTEGNTPWLYAGASGGNPGTRLSKISVSTGMPTSTSLTVEEVDSLLPSPDGKLYVGGKFNLGIPNPTPNYFVQGFMKVDPATLTATTEMALTNSAGFNGRVLAMAREEIPNSTSGRLWVGGDFFTYRGAHASNLARLELATGKIETPSHCGSGSGTDGPVKALAISGSSIFIGGPFAKYCTQTAGGLLKLSLPATAQGAWSAAPDTSFHSGTGATAGVGATPVGTIEVSALAISPDGSSVFAGGNFINYRNYTANRLVKLDATTGERDTSFYPIPSQGVSTYGTGGPVVSLALSADGTALYAGGSFGTYGSPATYVGNLIKVNAQNGALDTGFTQTTGFNLSVNALAWASDGLYVGGGFTSYRGSPMSRIAKLNPATGLPVAGWGTTAGFTGSVTSLALDQSSLIAGGVFSYASQATPGLAKLSTATGLLDTTFRTGTLFTSPTDFVPACMALSGGTLILGGSGLEHRGELAPYLTTINASDGQFND